MRSRWIEQTLREEIPEVIGNCGSMIIMQVKKIVDEYAGAFGVPAIIENFSIDDNKNTWNNFMHDLIEPLLKELKEIHDNMGVNVHIPVVDENSGIVLTQRQALQEIICNALEMVASSHLEEANLPIAISTMLEQGTTM